MALEHYIDLHLALVYTVLREAIYILLILAILLMKKLITDL